MYFRLMAAIFDLPVTPTSENIQICAIALLDFKNWGCCRKFDYITFELRHHIYIRSDGRHFDFGERGLTFFCY